MVMKMKLLKTKFKENVGYFYLDAVDFADINNNLNNFILPDKTEFISMRELIVYATNIIPENVTEAFAKLHYVRNDIIQEETALLFKYKKDGTLQQFKC